MKCTLCLLLIGLLAPMLWAAEGAPLRYEPNRVTLSGGIVEKTFPGPPNYEDVSEGDKPEAIWMLRLSQHVNVIATQDDDPLLYWTEHGVREMQLVFVHALNKKSYADYREMLGRRVTITGELFHSINWHHRTKVLVVVLDIQRAVDIVMVLPIANTVTIGREVSIPQHRWVAH